jgi:hypothetical protein
MAAPSTNMTKIGRRLPRSMDMTSPTPIDDAIVHPRAGSRNRETL